MDRITLPPKRSKTRVLITRTAMIGGGLSYDVYVPVRDLPEWHRPSYMTVLDGVDFVRLPEATQTRQHYESTPGPDRYDAWKLHEAAALRRALDLACAAFPELEQLRSQTDRLPLLWVSGLIAREAETSACAWTSIDPLA